MIGNESFSSVMADTPKEHYTATEHIFFFLKTGYISGSSANTKMVTEYIGILLFCLGVAAWAFSMVLVAFYFFDDGRNGKQVLTVGPALIWLVGWFASSVAYAAMYKCFSTTYLAVEHKGWKSISIIVGGVFSWLNFIVIAVAVIGVWRRNRRLRKERFEEIIRGENKA